MTFDATMFAAPIVETMTPGTVRTGLLLLLLAASVLGGCRSDERIAREQFASAFTCPGERITATLRKGLDPVALSFRPAPPPSDVAADPRRLELWNEEQARRGAEHERKAVVQARGCGRRNAHRAASPPVTIAPTLPRA